MNLVSRTITGIFMIIFGLVFMGISFFTKFSFLISGIFLVIIGIFIFFNKKEDKIEEIKRRKEK